jgi:hypothetical protein
MFIDIVITKYLSSVGAECHELSIILYFKPINISLLQSLGLMMHHCYKYFAPDGALLFIFNKIEDIFALERYLKLL